MPTDRLRSSVRSCPDDTASARANPLNWSGSVPVDTKPWDAHRVHRDLEGGIPIPIRSAALLPNLPPGRSRTLPTLLLLAGLASSPAAHAHFPSVFTDQEMVAQRRDADTAIQSTGGRKREGLEMIMGPVSYYSRAMAGRRTASGERFDPDALTMAHPTLPFGTRVLITLPDSSRSVVVRVNDRGPIHGSRIADLSPAAANVLGFLRRGLTQVRLEVLSAVAGSRPAASPTDH